MKNDFMKGNNSSLSNNRKGVEEMKVGCYQI